MWNGYKSIITALVGVAFVVAAHYIPAEYLTAENKDVVCKILEGLYGVFLAAKVNRLIASADNGGK